MLFLQKYWPFLGILIVYIAGAFLDVMDIDAAQYASISREMMETGDFFQVKHRNQDYLDKPPLLFWFSAIIFKMFGVYSFTYRVAPILFSLLGTYATYRLAKLYYNETTAYLSALCIASCQAYFLMNHDVRTDTMLTASTIFAIWQIAEFNEKKKFIHIVLGFTGIAFAMLAKGPIGLMVPVLAFTTDFVLKRQWGSFFRWQWLVGLVIVALFLFPMAWGLYEQFDAQPEKIFDGRTGVSGLRFFFWTQSFGRITGESNWDNHPGIFFQAQNFLWSFLPWVFLIVPGLFLDIKNVFSKRLKLPLNEEAITLGGFVLPFIALSMSRYQLPHYTYVVFPLGAIITGKYLALIIENESYKKWFSISNALQVLTMSIMFLILSALCFWAFPLDNFFVGLVIGLTLGGVVYFSIKSKNKYQKIVYPSLICILGVNLILNTYIYPSLFKYQIGSVMGKYLKTEADFPLDRFYVLIRVFGDDRDIFVHTLDFYSQRINPELQNAIELKTIAQTGDCWIYTDVLGLKEIQDLGYSTTILKEYDKYHVAVLTLPFLNPDIRPSQIQKVYLLKFSLKK